MLSHHRIGEAVFLPEFLLQQNLHFWIFSGKLYQAHTYVLNKIVFDKLFYEGCNMFVSFVEKAVFYSLRQDSE